MLLRLLEDYAHQKRKVLIFSQARNTCRALVSDLTFNTVYPNSGYPPSRPQAEEYQIFAAHGLDCRRCPAIARRRIHRGRIYTRLPPVYQSRWYGN